MTRNATGTADDSSRSAVDTDRLSRERNHVAGRIGLAGLARLAPMLASTAGEIAYELHGEIDERGRPAATLRASATLTQRCDLCERDVVLPLDVQARYYFVRDAGALDTLPLEDDDEREPLVGGRRFDVAQLVEDEAILALPISPRHAACESERAAHGDAQSPGTESGAATPSATHHGGADVSVPARDGTEPGRSNPFSVLASLKGRGTR